MVWIILSVIAGIIIILFIRHIFRGGNYAITTRNVITWYSAFRHINNGENNPSLKITSLLEAAAVGSQNIYLKSKDFSLAEIKEIVDDVAEEFEIAETKWNEINPELEVEILLSFIMDLMVLIYEADFKKIGPDVMIAGIEKNESLIKMNIHQQLQKPPSSMSMRGASIFAKRNPNYLEGFYVQYK